MGAPEQTGMKKGMKEICIEGVANHDNPESYASHCKGASEPLKGACIGRANESRSGRTEGADAVHISGRLKSKARYRERNVDPAGIKI